MISFENGVSVAVITFCGGAAAWTAKYLVLPWRDRQFANMDRQAAAYELMLIERTTNEKSYQDKMILQMEDRGKRDTEFIGLLREVANSLKELAHSQARAHEKLDDIADQVQQQNGTPRIRHPPTTSPSQPGEAT